MALLEPRSLFEERCYVLHANWSPEDFLKAFRPEALEIQRNTLGGLVGYFSVEVGELNAIVSLWEYPSFEERAIRRARLAADPRWQSYLAVVRPMIRSMSNRLMTRQI